MGIASMTGFARTQGDAFGISWVWEIKSVNGKSLDLRLRLPQGFDPLEPQLRATLAQRFRRGNFSASLTASRTAPAAVRVNRETLAQLVGLMNELAGEIEAAPPRIDGLLALRGVVEIVEDELDGVADERRQAVLAGWSIGLDRLTAARTEEGVRLYAVLGDQIAEMRGMIEAAAACAAAQPEAIRERLEKMLASVADLVPGMPADRIAQEMAILIARSDVREELERLRAHVQQAAELLECSEAVGRRLDFLCQELNREANTLCSKSADIELTRAGLSLKAAIEQLREQVQNIE
ncbi:MAG: YicC/YloC family endoribonuclease [Stellaceae bacterium]